MAKKVRILKRCRNIAKMSIWPNVQMQIYSVAAAPADILK